MPKKLSILNEKILDVLRGKKILAHSEVLRMLSSNAESIARRDESFKDLEDPDLKGLLIDCANEISSIDEKIAAAREEERGEEKKAALKKLRQDRGAVLKRVREYLREHYVNFTAEEVEEINAKGLARAIPFVGEMANIRVTLEAYVAKEPKDEIRRRLEGSEERVLAESRSFRGWALASEYYEGGEEEAKGDEDYGDGEEETKGGELEDERVREGDHLVVEPVEVAYMVAFLQYADDLSQVKIENFRKRIGKLRSIFGDDIELLYKFAVNYKMRNPDSICVLIDAADSIDWPEGRGSCAVGWRKLVADVKSRGAAEKLIGKFDGKIGDPFPESVDELIERAWRMECPKFLKKLSEVSDFPEDFSKERVEEFAKDFYQLRLRSKPPGGNVKRHELDSSLCKALVVIVDPQRKKQVGDMKTLPDITLKTEDVQVISPELEAALEKLRFDQSMRDKFEHAYFKGRRNLTFRKLDDSDYRGFYLGVLLGNCQSIDSQGREYAK